MFQHYWYQCVGGGVVERRAHLAEKEARECSVGGGGAGPWVLPMAAPLLVPVSTRGLSVPLLIYTTLMSRETHTPTNVKGKQCGNCGINTKYLKSSEIMIQRLERIALCCIEHTHTYTHMCTQRSNLDHWEGFCYLASDLQLAFFKANFSLFSSLPALCVGFR